MPPRGELLRCALSLLVVRWKIKGAVTQEEVEMLRGLEIPKTLMHDAGAIARCSYCGRYTDDKSALADVEPPKCDCGRRAGWCGSFEPPTEASQWSNHNAKLSESPCSRFEGYPVGWWHCTIHLNPDTGEMHSDGDHRVRTWIQNQLQEAQRTSCRDCGSPGPFRGGLGAEWRKV